jgi:hypothetical protein
MRAVHHPAGKRLPLLTANSVLGRISAFEKSELAKPSFFDNRSATQHFGSRLPGLCPSRLSQLSDESDR